METVVSKDGTEIAYDTYGQGPGLVLVAGGFTERSRYVGDAEALASTFTVVNYDRRGRGDSGDTLPYAVEREWEDLEAVRAATGARFACAYSSGSMVLLQARLPFEKQAVMEPPFRVEGAPPPPEHYVERLQEYVAAGNPGGAAELFMTEAVGQPKAAVDQLKETPAWPRFEAIAHTLVYDALQLRDNAVPTELLASIDVPTLALFSNASPDWLKNATRQTAAGLPNGTVEGYDGTFHTIPSDTLARALTAYFLST
ncbi:alpha/beta hydrolase [Kribbella sp. NPDC026611]|uniref:alpha/beta fold hydrolase n=1 Tax=Kribbella sp. NPDC026611 TaxID=3154911 RepID=UPI0033D93E5A